MARGSVNIGGAGVENVLTSTSTTNALSAAQGKVLQDGKAIKPTNESTATDGQILVSNGGGTCTFETWVAPPTSQSFSSNGTFIVPTGVTTIYFTGCSSGANGVGGDFTNSGPGGAGGSILISKPFSVTPGQSLAVTVGSGNTVLGSLQTLVKGGGAPGGAASNSTTPAGAGTNTAYATGGPGGGAFAAGGGGAGWIGGNGGAGGSSSGGNGGAGSPYGGGGGGGGSGDPDPQWGYPAGTGGAGGNGFLLLEW